MVLAYGAAMTRICISREPVVVAPANHRHLVDESAAGAGLTHDATSRPVAQLFGLDLMPRSRSTKAAPHTRCSDSLRLLVPLVGHGDGVRVDPFVQDRPAEAPIVAKPEAGDRALMQKPADGEGTAMQVTGDIAQRHDLAPYWYQGLSFS
jgi:hypothetical protein